MEAYRSEQRAKSRGQRTESRAESKGQRKESQEQKVESRAHVQSIAKREQKPKHKEQGEIAEMRGAKSQKTGGTGQSAEKGNRGATLTETQGGQVA
jgi:hypothetical protein